MKNDEPAIQELPERHVAYVAFTGNYIGNPRVFADLFQKLCAWAGPKGLLTPKSVFLSSYQDDPNTTPPDELTLEVCVTAPEDTEAEGDILTRVLPGGQYAVMHAELTGAEEYGPAWNEVVEWVQKSDYEIDMSRPSYEIYLNDPSQHPEGHHILDICLSVRAKG